MKINWGAGIAALYLSFVAMILLLVTMSAGQKIDLVTEHYYDEELRFQDKIEKIKRTQALSEPLVWNVQEKGISIEYPANLDEKRLSGQIQLYCPANDKNDRQFNIDPTTKNQFISTADIPAGTYHLQIDWKAGELTYWNEGVITLNPLK